MDFSKNDCGESNGQRLKSCRQCFMKVGPAHFPAFPAADKSFVVNPAAKKACNYGGQQNFSEANRAGPRHALQLDELSIHINRLLQPDVGG
jgi:hypothetical protein